MTTALGLLGVILFIVGVIALAAGVTYAVVKITPSKSAKEQQQVESSPS
jgi:flagellar basal body-associated protein FliL